MVSPSKNPWNGGGSLKTLNKRYRHQRGQVSDYTRILEFLNGHGDDLLRSGPLERLLPREIRDRFDPRFNVTFLIETKGGCIVAHAQLCLRQTDRRRVGTVENVLVAKGHRGRGLSRVLMETLIAYAREYKRCDRIELVSEPERAVARGLYEKLGFRLVGGSDRHYQLKL